MSRNVFTVEDEAEVAEVGTFPQLQEPKKYQVFLLNDDYTPMDFVVEVLRRFFQMSDALATEVMLNVHINGRAICGCFTRDVAETKVVMVNDYARMHEHPLLCGMEHV